MGGKHQKEEAIDLLEDLKKRGEQLGMKPIEEFPLARGKFQIDLAWCNPKSDVPVVTFEVETDKRRWVRNLAKISTTDRKRTTHKPWFHILIFLSHHLTSGDRDLVEGLSSSQNIHIVENLLGDPMSGRKLEKILLDIGDGLSQQRPLYETEPAFEKRFIELLDTCTRLLLKSDISANDAIDNLIAEFRKAIQDWNVPAIRYATRSIVLNLGKPKTGITCIYRILRDPFLCAHKERRRLLGVMLQELSYLWIEEIVHPRRRKWLLKSLGDILTHLTFDFSEKDEDVSRDASGVFADLMEMFQSPDIYVMEICLAVILRDRLPDSQLSDDVFSWLLFDAEDLWLCDRRSFDSWFRRAKTFAMDHFDISVQMPGFKREFMRQLGNRLIAECVGYLLDITSETHKLSEDDILYLNADLRDIQKRLATVLSDVPQKAASEMDSSTDMKRRRDMLKRLRPFRIDPPLSEVLDLISE